MPQIPLLNMFDEALNMFDEARFAGKFVVARLHAVPGSPSIVTSAHVPSHNQIRRWLPGAREMNNDHRWVNAAQAAGIENVAGMLEGHSLGFKLNHVARHRSVDGNAHGFGAYCAQTVHWLRS
jgi:hypothetical protein